MSLDLITVFGAGLLTFVTPCVLPLVPIYLAALVGGDLRGLSGSGRWRLLWRAGLFSLGFVSVFTLMGLGASSIGAFLGEHRAVLQVAGALVVLVFALKFLGLIRVPFLDRVVKADDTRLETRFASVNALVMGVVFAAGWSPCVGPVLGSVLTFTASSANSPAVGAGYLALYGAGFALPLLVVAAFAGVAARLLERVGPLLPKIEKGVGVLLLVVAGFLVHDAAGMWSVPEERDSDLADHSMPVMIELFEEDCPVCQRMKPLMTRLEEQCDRRGVRVVAIDVSREENAHLVERYRLVGVPTFLFLDRGGDEVARLIGEQTERTLKQALSALRGEECPGLALLGPRPGDEANLGIQFPVVEEEEMIACPSTSTDATSATRPSRSSYESPRRTTSDAQAVIDPPESCSQVLP
jgi:cytochrome c-type biogenesis protein